MRPSSLESPPRLHPVSKVTVLTNVLAVGALCLIGLVVVLSYARGGLVADLAAVDLSAAEKLAAVRASFEAWGALAPLAYILFVTTEVVIAPLPGLMLYAPGGILFGGFLGGLYALIGNLLGAAIACQVMRLIGVKFFGAQIRHSLGALAPLLDRQGVWVVFLLRVNPLTSSDLVSYAAGLSQLATWKVVVGTAMGMAPLCWAQAYLAEGLMSAYPGLVNPLIAASALYLLVVCRVLWKMTRRPVSGQTAPSEG